MKIIALLALTVGSVEAFTPPSMTFAVGKKPAAPVKKAAPAPVKKAAPVATKAVAPKKPAPVATKVVAPKKVAPVAKKVVPTPVKKAAPAPVKKAAPVVAKKAAPVVVAKKPVVVAKKPAPVVKKPVPVKAVVKKPAPVKKVAAPVKKIVVKKSSTYSGGVVPSTAIPGEVAPDLLNGSLPGDVGFDPCFLSTRADSVSDYFNGLFSGTSIDGLTWYREAELMHGRICMVAVLGFIWPGFSHFDGNSWTGVDAYSYTNPLEALDKAPGAALFQIFGFMALLEFRRVKIILKEGSNYMAGDSQKWGQGAGRYNPFNLNYTPAEYAEKQLQEIKHARLAMIAFLALVFQANASGVGVVDQLAGAFTVPDYYAKAGYFLPEGI